MKTRRCKWCNENVEAPATAHTMPPCEAAPKRWKKRWEKEKSLRDKIDKSLEIISNMASK